MKNKSRILAIILVVLLMASTIIPQTLFASENTLVEGATYSSKFNNVDAIRADGWKGYFSTDPQAGVPFTEMTESDYTNQTYYETWGGAVITRSQKQGKYNTFNNWNNAKVFTNMAALTYTPQKYKYFELTVEYKYAAKDNPWPLVVFNQQNITPEMFYRSDNVTNPTYSEDPIAVSPNYAGSIRIFGKKASGTQTISKNMDADNSPQWHKMKITVTPGNIYAAVYDDDGSLALEWNAALDESYQGGYITLMQNGVSHFKNIAITSFVEESECTHETTKENITKEATYFTTGLKNVVCADEACGAVVEENVVIERITADPITYTYSYNAKAAALTINGTFSEALVLDMIATNGAEFTLNYEVAGKTYKVENIAVAKEDVGVEIIISGFNKARLGKVKFNLEISWNGAVGVAYTDNAAEFNSKTNGEVDVTTLITGEDKTAYDAFEEAIEAEDEKEIGTTADANNAFMNNSFKVNLAEGSAELKFSINDALRQTLKDNGGHEAAGRVVTFKLKIGENTYEEVIEELRVHMTVNITGLSFTHMNSEISAWLEVTYTDSAKNFSTADNSVVYNSTQIIENAATAGNGIAAAFKDLMN